MSLPKKSIHIRQTDEEHGMATVLASLAHMDVASYISWLVAKQLRAEFHVVSVQAKEFARLGLGGNDRDSKGVRGT